MVICSTIAVFECKTERLTLFVFVQVNVEAVVPLRLPQVWKRKQTRGKV